MGHEEVRSQLSRPASGWGVGIAARLPDGGCNWGKHDRIHADIPVAGRFRVGPVFPGGRSGSYLGGPRGITGQVLSGTGFAAPYAADGPRRCRTVFSPSEVETSQTFIEE